VRKQEATLLRWLRLLKGDLARTAGPGLLVQEGAWSEQPDIESAWLVSSTGAETGVWVLTTDEDADQVVTVAEQVQDFVHEELQALGRPVVWPGCPFHPGSHPLAPAVRERAAWWTCVAAGRGVAPVGAL
jgi:hypothetical protein